MDAAAKLSSEEQAAVIKSLGRYLLFKGSRQAQVLQTLCSSEVMKKYRNLTNCADRCSPRQRAADADTWLHLLPANAHMAEDALMKALHKLDDRIPLYTDAKASKGKADPSIPELGGSVKELLKLFCELQYLEPVVSCTPCNMQYKEVAFIVCRICNASRRACSCHGKHVHRIQ